MKMANQKKVKMKVIENRNLPMLFWIEDQVYKIFPSTLREVPVIFSTMLSKYKEVYWEETWAIMAAEAWELFRESARQCRVAPFTLKIVSQDDGGQDNKEWVNNWRKD